MTKAYWVATYREIMNQDNLTEYAKLAGPAIAACGGRFLARGLPAIAKEAGLIQRVVLIEFDSLDMAKGCLLYTSPSPRDRQKSRMPSSA